MRGKTVFIIGAGASKEFGLPLGRELVDVILNALNESFSGGYRADRQSRLLSTLLRPPSGLTSALSSAVQKARGGLLATPSIDSFLHDWRGDPDLVRVCKLALAQAINEAESASSLRDLTEGSFELTHTALRNVRNTWLAHLFENLVTGVQPEQTDQALSNLGFVNFNYDRCVEHYLYHAFHLMRDQTPGRSRALVSAIPIFHPYGVVGKLPWQDSSQGVPFGDVESELSRISGPVRTFTEELQDQEMLQSLRGMIAAAEQLVFLGFGFHPQNMELLFGGAPKIEVPIYGTQMGVPQHLHTRINQCVGNTGDRIFEALGCRELLEKWGHVIFERMRAAPEDWRAVN